MVERSWRNDGCRVGKDFVVVEAVWGYHVGSGVDSQFALDFALDMRNVLKLKNSYDNLSRLW